MSTLFDDLSRALATSMPRRRALRAIGVTLAVAAIPALRPATPVARAARAATCPGMSFCKSPNIPCCVAVPNGYHLGGCCGPAGKCCIGVGQDGLPASWCCPDQNYTCGPWGTADQCSCTTKCQDGSCCPRSKGRCVSGKCCPAIRTTRASSGKAVTCCPPGTVAVPGARALCCRKGDLDCCDKYDPRKSEDDELTNLGPRKGTICVNGKLRKG